MRAGRAQDGLNLLAVLAALLAASLGGGLAEPASEPARPAAAPQNVVRRERTSAGEPALRDARGVLVPLRPYRRIASATWVADRVLLELSEPQRLIAFSEPSARDPQQAHRYAGKAHLGVRAPLEEVLALKPALLLVNDMVEASYLSRLCESGVQVFDLGHMRGFSSLLVTIETIGYLLGAPERTARYAASLERRWQALTARAPSTRPRALYLSAYGDKLYGGGAETSYHDILEAAGLHDAAASAGLTGWPELSPEQVLALDPEVLVTQEGSGRLVCARPGLSALRPCMGSGRILELPVSLLDDPGPGMVEAAEALHQAAWQPQ